MKMGVVENLAWRVRGPGSAADVVSLPIMDTCCCGNKAIVLSILLAQRPECQGGLLTCDAVCNEHRCRQNGMKLRKGVRQQRPS
jgi:hypothetical protein